MKKGMLILFWVTCGVITQAQVKIGNNPTSISPGSLLELESTSKALTLPRMTTVQMQAIASPKNGMIIYNTDSNCLYLYRNGNTWASINMNPVAAPAPAWPYQTNDQVIGINGNAKGIISLTGNGLVATGDYSHAEGLNSAALGAHSWSSGFADTAANTASIAMGYQNVSLGEYSIAMGYKNTTAYQSAVAMGQENTDSGWSSMAFGYRNKIFKNTSYSSGIGFNNAIKGGWANTGLGETNTINSGRANLAVGLGNVIDGNYNNAFGHLNIITNGSAHMASGMYNQLKSGIGSAIFGQSNTADGFYLGTIGANNSVFFQSAVALGQDNKDSGWASIAGGVGNVIEKNTQYSAAFGYNNLSTKNMLLASNVYGSGMFTAGVYNVNSGYGSMAFGGYNRSSNVYSLAANYSNLANSSSMSAFGHFNDTTTAYQGLGFEPTEMLFSIGNGSNDASRRNSFTMLRNGFTTINTTAENGANVPRAELDVKGTGAIIVPVGTTAQRPETPVVGMIRFCTDCPGGAVLQGYNGTEWVNL